MRIFWRVEFAGLLASSLKRGRGGAGIGEFCGRCMPGRADRARAGRGRKNGGILPFLRCRCGDVGRAMLEELRKAERIERVRAMPPKPVRLATIALVRTDRASCRPSPTIQPAPPLPPSRPAPPPVRSRARVPGFGSAIGPAGRPIGGSIILAWSGTEPNGAKVPAAATGRGERREGITRQAGRGGGCSRLRPVKGRGCDGALPIGERSALRRASQASGGARRVN